MQLSSSSISTCITWNCGKCTFENSVTEFQCQMCSNPIPPKLKNQTPGSQASFERVASADLDMLNLSNVSPSEPSWKRNAIELSGMMTQADFDAFTGLRSESRSRVPVVAAASVVSPSSASASIPASSVEVSTSPRIKKVPSQNDLAESGQSLLNNFLEGKGVFPISPRSNPQQHHTINASSGLRMFNQTKTAQDPGFLTEEERRDSFYSMSSYDDDYYDSRKRSSTFDDEDANQSFSRDSTNFTTFTNFGGVGNKATGKDDRDNKDASRHTGFSVEDSFKPTAKERWRKAVLKIQTVRSFGGIVGAAKEYELPPEIEAKRLVAREELLSSEKEYYSRLSILVDCFMTPLITFIDNTLGKAQFSRVSSSGGGGSFSSSMRENDGVGIVAAGGITENTAKEARAVFGNIVQIRDLTKHLLGDLEVVIADPQAKIGPVFVKLAPFLRMYLIYYQSFNAARSALDKLRTAFWCDSFISACEAQPCCKGRGIKDFMIEPVQRVPRYELLIKEVIRYTPPGHPNNPMLLEALKQVKEVADGMNMDMGSTDSRLKVASLSVAWVGVDFTAPHRMFLKEGALVKTDRHGIKRKNYFLLFNDLMCYGDKIDESKLFMRRRTQSGGEGAETGSDSDRYKLRFKAPLLECLVIDDTMVYGKHGALRLRDDTPYAAAMMTAAAKKGGDVGRLARAMESVSGGSNNSEAAQAWELLESCGASMDRVLESQLCDKSFLIQVEGKTLFLTAASVQERKEWVTAFADAIRNSLEEEKQHRNGQRRLSALNTKMETTHRTIVANESLFSRLTGQKGIARRPSTNQDK